MNNKKNDVSHIFNTLFSELGDTLKDSAGDVLKVKEKYYKILVYLSSDEEGYKPGVHDIWLAPIVYSTEHGVYEDICEELELLDLVDTIGMFTSFEVVTYRDAFEEIFSEKIKYVDSEIEREYASFLECYPVELDVSAFSYDSLMELYDKGIGHPDLKQANRPECIYGFDELRSEDIEMFVKRVMGLKHQSNALRQQYFKELVKNKRSNV